MQGRTSKSVAIGAAWMVSARIVINSLAFVSTLILARLLTPEDFGIVAIVVAASAIITAVTEVSLAEALIKLDKPTDRDYDTAWTINLCRGVALCAVLIGLAFPLASVFDDQRLVPLFAVSALGIALGSLNNPRIVEFRRNLNFQPDFQFLTVDKIVAFVVAISIAWAYRSYWALVVGATAAAAVRMVMTYIKLPYLPRLDLSSWRKLMSFSIWLTLAHMTKTVNARGVALIASAFLSTSALGQYSFGERVAVTPVREAGGALQTTLYPAFSRMADDLARMRAAYVRAQGVASLVTLPIGLGIAGVAEPLVAFGLGEKWLPSVPVIQALAVAGAVQSIQNSQPLAMATDNTKESFLRNLRILMIRVPFAFGGLMWGEASQYGGLVGLSIGLVASAFINIALNMTLIRRLIDCPVRDQWALAARPLMAGFAMLGSVLMLQFWLQDSAIKLASFLGLAVLVTAGALVYFAVLLVLHLALGSRNSAEMEVLQIARHFVGGRLGNKPTGT